MSSFLNEMRDAHDWLRENGRVEEVAAIQAVMSFRLSAGAAAYLVNIDLENIEHLFSLSDALENGLEKSVRLAIAATLDYCLSVKPEKVAHFTSYKEGLDTFPQKWRQSGVVDGDRYPFTTSMYELATFLMMGKGEKGKKQKTTFITFNYDMLVENALTSISEPYSYGFKAKSVNYDASFGDRAHKNDVDVSILKLHGSVNWAIPQKRGNKLTIFSSFSDVMKEKLVPHIVPPTWRKIFSGQIFDVWNEAVRSISSATRVFVVGFSMPETDQHFKYLLAAGLKNNVSLRTLSFVNPDRSGVEEKIDFSSKEVGEEIYRFMDIHWEIT